MKLMLAILLTILISSAALAQIEDWRQPCDIQILTATDKTSLVDLIQTQLDLGWFLISVPVKVLDNPATAKQWNVTMGTDDCGT